MLLMSFLGKTIHPYGVFCTLGIFISVVVALVLAKKKGFEFFDFSLIIIVTLLSALIGAKLMFLIVSWEIVCEIFTIYPFWQAIVAIINGGFVFYGGLIGGIVGLIITLKVKKVKFFDYASIFALVLPLGHSFGRIGCFYAGCCYGIEYEGFLSYTYNSALNLSTPIGSPLFPIQLVEAVSLLLLFIFMLFLYCSIHNKKYICYVYLIGYSIIRFILEFFRGDLERGSIFSFSISQWLSLLIFAISIILIIFSIIKNKKTKSGSI